MALSERSCTAGHGTSVPWGWGIKDLIDFLLSWGDLKPFLNLVVNEVSGEKDLCPILFYTLLSMSYFWETVLSLRWHFCGITVALLHLLLYHKDLKARINRGHSHRMLLALPCGPIAFSLYFYSLYFSWFALCHSLLCVSVCQQMVSSQRTRSGVSSL